MTFYAHQYEEKVKKGNLLVFRLFRPLALHFAQIFVRQHIIFHFLAAALLNEEQRHGHKEEPYRAKANAFIGQYRIFFHGQEPIADGDGRSKDHKRHYVLVFYPHGYLVNVINLRL